MEVVTNYEIMVQDLENSLTEPQKKSIGKMTKNPFFNFVRDYRGIVDHKRQREIIKNAAEAWRELPENEKLVYYSEAMKFKREQILSTV
jgi:hypothetical protein